MNNSEHVVFVLPMMEANCLWDSYRLRTIANVRSSHSLNLLANEIAIISRFLLN